MKGEPCLICGRTPEIMIVSTRQGGPPEIAFSAVAECRGHAMDDPKDYHALRGPYEDGPTQEAAQEGATELWNIMVKKCRETFTSQQTS